MPVIVLLDTNIWVSALINPHGHPAKLIRAWLDNQFQVVVSVPLLDELADVLARPRIRDKYGLDTAETAQFLQLLSVRAVRVTPSGQLNAGRDPDDDLILETAVLGQAHYLVSRDDDIKRDVDLIKQMANHGIEVLSTQQFLEQLNVGL